MYFFVPLHKLFDYKTNYHFLQGRDSMYEFLYMEKGRNSRTFSRNTHKNIKHNKKLETQML
jgi:hypothetical protein